MDKGSVSRVLASLGLGKRFNVLCTCYMNKSLSGTLSIYSTVNPYVQKNVYIIP